MRFKAHDSAQRCFVQHNIDRHHRELAYVGLFGGQKGSKAGNRLHTHSIIRRKLCFESIDELWNACCLQICLWIFVSALHNIVSVIQLDIL